MNQRQNITISSTNSTYVRSKNKIRENGGCGLLCANVTGPPLSVCRKQADQVYSSVYKLSNSTTYDWLSFLAYSTVVPSLNF